MCGGAAKGRRLLGGAVMVTVPGMEIVRIANGKLVEGWEGYDSGTLMQQLGVM